MLLVWRYHVTFEQRLFLTWLLAVCKALNLFPLWWDSGQGRRPFSFLLLVEVCCRWCGASFCVCRRCWRGQVYCSEECGRLGRGRVHREAQRRYRQTPKGKKAHRQGENRRRHGWSKKNEKKMDDLSSKGLTWCVIGLLVYAHFLMIRARAWFDSERRCHFCGCKGQVVDGFPRRE